MSEQGGITREQLLSALEETGGNRRKAADLLSMGRATFYRWLDRHGLGATPARPIGGRYQLIAPLGEGGQARVFAARDRVHAGRRCAVKLFKASTRDSVAHKRATQEFRVLSRLRHPGLVRVLDTGVDAVSHDRYLVMEWVEGTQFLDAARDASPEWIMRALQQALRAVAHLHRQGLIHRDLKSENLLVDARDPERPAHVTVMDLGLSEHFADVARGPGGTLLYAAPEVLLGARATPRSDLYAIGVLAYRSLTGRFPFEGATLGETIEAHRRGVPPAPSQFSRSVSPALDRVIAGLLATDPAQRYSDADAASEAIDHALEGTGPRLTMQQTVRSVEFVGRDHELTRLLGTLSFESGDRASSVLLYGDAGIGKSRLCHAVIDAMTAAGARVARAECQPGVGEGHAPLRSLLDEALGGADGSGRRSEDEAVRRHRTALAQLAPQAFVDEPAPAPPSREQAISAVVDVLESAACRQPLLIVIDNLQFADSMVLEIVERLGRVASKLPLKLLLAARPFDDWPGLARFAQLGSTEGWLKLELLGPLDLEGVRALSSELLGPANALLSARALLTLTAGNPFYLGTVLRELIDDGRSVAEIDKLPTSIQEAVRVRLYRAGEPARDLLSWIATASGSAALHDLVTLSPEPVEPIVEELLRRRLIVETGERQYEPAHSFVREACLNLLEPQQRQRRHAAWAACLDRQPEHSIQAAEQWLAAGQTTAKREQFLEAAERLERVWRYAAAIPFYESALNGLDPLDPVRLRIYPRLERACHRLRDTKRAAAVCTEWVQLARHYKQSAVEARALSLLAARYRDHAAWAEAEQASSQALTLAQASGDAAAGMLAQKILASVLWIGWRHDEALVHLEHALVAARSAASPRDLALCLNDIALPYALSGRVEAAFSALDESESIFRELGDAAWVTSLRSTRTMCLQVGGDLESAAVEAQRACAEMRSLGGPVPLELVLENLALVLVRLGRYEETLDVCSALADEALRFGRHAFRVSALLLRGEALHQLDERGVAREHHRLAFELAQLHQLSGQLGFARLALARDRREQGQVAEARMLALAAYEDASARRNLRTQALAALELARIDAALGDPTNAHIWLDRAGDALRVPREDGLAHRALYLLERARLRRMQSRTTMALADVEEALGLARRYGPIDAEVALWRLAADLHADGNNAAAAGMAMASARAAIERVGAAMHDPARRARYFARPDLSLVLASAPSASAAMRYGKESNNTAALGTLYELSKRVAEAGDTVPLLKRVVQIAVERSGADRGLLLLLDPNTGTLVPSASVAIEAQTQNDAIRVSRTVVQHADRGRSVLARDARTDPQLAHAKSVALFGIRSVMCVPLRVADEVLGTLYVDTRSQHAGFNQDSLQFLEALAAQAAFALAYARIVRQVRSERDDLARTAHVAPKLGGLVGTSPPMQRLVTLLERVADADLPVIVLGESGSGKELAAKALHEISTRRQRQFVTVDCAAIPETLLESTLFGHVRGAFTGADRDRTGLFEQAHGGTLLIDGLTEFPPGAQAKLLRVLQEHQVRPLGGAEPIAVDVRVIVATRDDLSALVDSGQLRRDLYFRLNGVTAVVPPLRERKSDIPALLQHFLTRAAVRAQTQAPEVDAGVLRALMHYDWPGNVRELENMATRMLLYVDAGRISVAGLSKDKDLSALVSRTLPPRSAGRGSKVVDRLAERIDIERALAGAAGNRDHAARRLGISRATLYRRLRELGLG